MGINSRVNGGRFAKGSTRADIETNVRILNKLRWPKEKVDVVIDTDTYNEIDDQYAIAYALRSPDRMTVKAIYAAPFDNDKCADAKEGMELSFKEIHNICTLLGETDILANTFRGAEQFLPDEKTPVMSDAVNDLVERAMTYTEENPLYVIALGAITNIASALLVKPEIADRIVLIWLGGHGKHWPHTFEFNMLQDVAAARVVYLTKLPMVLLPCQGVVSGFTVSGPDLEHWLRGKNDLCNYLCDVTIAEAEERNKIATWTRAIWDVTAVAWLVDESFMNDYIDHVPVPEYDDIYAPDPNGHLMRYVYGINRDRLLLDLFTKLAK